MANEQIGAMPDIVSLLATDEIPVVRGGANFSTTPLELAGFAATHVTNVPTATATGTNQAGAYLLSAAATIFDTVTSGTGARLPTWAANSRYTIINRGANSLLLYPASGDQIETLGINTAFSIPVNGSADAWVDATSVWRVTPNSPPNPILFGTGADGALAISSGTTTLTHDAHYTNLTISGAAKINAAGYKLFVSGTLDISAAGAQAIYNAGTAGNNASGATGGAGATSSQNGSVTSLWISATTSPAGGTGSTATGTVGGSPTAGASISGGASPNGATGGAGGSPGSAGGTATATAFGNGVLILQSVGQSFQALAARIIAGNSGPGGGCGGGDGVNAGGGGGGGGMGGLHVYISANIIARGTNATASIIQAIGGLGGNGANGVAGNTGGGGGGSGGGGGFVQIVAGSLTGSVITNAIDVSGGKSGNGGNGLGTGLGGLIAAGGNGGGVVIAVLSPSTITNTLVGNSITGVAGTAPSGATGGTGGVGAVARANL